MSRAASAAQEQRLREFSRPTRAWSEPPRSAAEPVAPSTGAEQTLWGTPLPVPATDVTRSMPAVPAATPSFWEVVRGDDIVRATPARPVREPRDSLPRAASLLGRAVPDRSAPTGTRRGASRAGGIFGGIAVAMAGIAVLSVALPGRSTADHPAARALAGETVALTQADSAGAGTSRPARHAAAGAPSQAAGGRSAHPVGALPAAFAMPASARGGVMPTVRPAVATAGPKPHRSSGAPSGSRSGAPSASASASAPVASASASASASAPVPSVSVSAPVPPVSPSASPSAPVSPSPSSSPSASALLGASAQPGN